MMQHKFHRLSGNSRIKIGWKIRAFAYVACGSLPTVAQVPPSVAIFEGETAKQWIAKLSDDDWHVQEAAEAKLAVPEAVPVLLAAIEAEFKPETSAAHILAIRIAGKIGPKAEAAVPALVKRLDNHSSEYRQEVALTLGKIGRASAKAVAPLLADKSSNARKGAAQTLYFLGPEAREVLPAVLSAMKDADDQVRRYAANAAVRAGPGDPAVLEALLLAVRAEAKQLSSYEGGFAQLDEPLVNFVEAAKDPSLPVLLKAVIDLDPAVRRAAAVGLGHAGKRAVPALSEAMNDSDLTVREAAAEALKTLGPEAGDAASGTPLEALKDKDPKVRAEAVRRAWELAPVDEENAIPLLLEILKTDVPENRVLAAEALGLFQGSSFKAVPALLEAMKEGQPGALRLQAVVALGRIGESAEAAAPALKAALEDKSAVLADAAALAMGAIGSTTVPHLVPILGSPDAGLRVRACRALGLVKPPAKETVIAVAGLLKDPATTAAALDALGNIGAAVRQYSPKVAKDAVPAVLAFLAGEKNAALRRQAIETLGLIGPLAAKDGAAPLVEALRDADPEIREAAARALGRIGAVEWGRPPTLPEAIPALLAALKDEKTAVKTAAVVALWKAASQADDVVAAAAETEKDPDAVIRFLAAWIRGPQEEAVGLLIEELDKGDGKLAEAAGDALADIGEQAFYILQDVLTEERGGRILDAARRALAKMGPEAIDGELWGQNPRLRRCALEAVALLQDAGSSSLLMDSLRRAAQAHPDGEARRLAAEAHRQTRTRR